MLSNKTQVADLSRQTYLGIGLSITGIPLGMYFSYFFPQIDWSQIFMVFSLIGIFSFKNLISFRLPSFGKGFIVIILFQLLMLIYGSFSDKMTFRYTAFHFYIIFLIVGLSSINTLRVNNRKVFLYTFLLSGFCSIFGALFMYSGLLTGAEAWNLRQENEEYALEIFTACLGAIYNLVSVLLLINKSKLYAKALFVVFLVLDLYIILFSGKRTPVFVCLVIFIVFFLKRDFKKGINLKSLFKYTTLLFLALVFVYFISSNFQLKIDTFFSNFYYGVLNLLGQTDVLDSTGSGLYRLQQRDWTYKYIDNNFNFFNYLLGAGYMTAWIDNPLIQSFLDMGIIGFIFYFYIVIYTPLKYSFKKMNELILFSFLLSIYGVLSSINSGNPYLYVKYIPVVFLLFASKANKLKFLRQKSDI